MSERERGFDMQQEIYYVNDEREEYFKEPVLNCSAMCSACLKHECEVMYIV